MMCTSEPSSLEGWVAVKEGLFQETKAVKCQSGKPNFFVNWNKETGQFTVTFTEHQRLKTDTVSCSYSAMLTPYQLREIHNCLKNLNGVLDQWFPSGLLELTAAWNGVTNYLWNVISTGLGMETQERNFMQYLEDSELDKLALQIQDYVTVAHDCCSHLTVMSCLFPDDFNFEEYFENLSELRHKAYLGRLDSARNRLTKTIDTRNEHLRKQRIAKKSASDTEWTFRSFTEDLTEATEGLLNVLAEYYNYLKQPFLDLREFSLEKYRQGERTLNSPDFGERVKDELRKMMPRWELEIRNSRENLRELELEYFENTRKVFLDYKAVLDKEAILIKRMKDPNNGQDCWALCQNLLCDADMRLAAENISFWNAKIGQLKAEKQTLCSEVGDLARVSDPEELMRKLTRLESQIYGKHAKILEARENVLREQDKYWRLRLKKIQKTIELNTDQGVQDGEDMFFDAAESEMDLERMLGKCKDPRMALVKESLLSAHKQLATIRNQKKKIVDQKNRGTFLESLASQEGSQQLQEVVQKKGSTMKQQRTQQVKKERGDTLQRIKEYRAKNPVATPKRKLPPNRSPPKEKPVASPRKSKSPTPTPDANSDKPTANQEARLVSPAPPVEKPSIVPGDDTPGVPPPCPIPPPPPPPPPPPNFLVPPPPPVVSLQPRMESIRTEENKAPAGSMDTVFEAIRAGVKLKKVGGTDGVDAQVVGVPGGTREGGNPLMRALEEKLKSVRRAMEDDSDKEEENDDEFDD